MVKLCDCGYGGEDVRPPRVRSISEWEKTKVLFLLCLWIYTSSDRNPHSYWPLLAHSAIKPCRVNTSPTLVLCARAAKAVEGHALRKAVEVYSRDSTVIIILIIMEYLYCPLAKVLFA